MNLHQKKLLLKILIFVGLIVSFNGIILFLDGKIWIGYYAKTIKTQDQLVKAMQDSIIDNYYLDGIPVSGDFIQDSIEEILPDAPLMYLRVDQSIAYTNSESSDSTLWKKSRTSHYFSKKVHLFDTISFTFFQAEIYGRNDSNFVNYVKPEYKSSFVNGERRVDKIIKKTFNYFLNGDSLYFEAKIGCGNIVPEGGFSIHRDESFFLWLFPIVFGLILIIIAFMSFKFIDNIKGKQ